jgi:hypothetical protein
MNTELEESTRTPKYRVESVEKIDPPAGMPEGDWFRYVISEGESKIEGFQPGSLYTVTQHAETFADDLNARAANGYSVYAARKKK